MTSEECDYHFVTITEACSENSQTLPFHSLQHAVSVYVFVHFNSQVLTKLLTS